MRLTALAATIALPFLTALPAQAQQASVAATDGNSAIGAIPCAALSNAPLGNCQAEYIDKGDGKATLRVALPGGRSRALYIEGGEFVGADTTDPVRASKANGIYYVFVGEAERYEVPATAVE